MTDDQINPMPDKPFAEGVATDETGAVLVTETILYLLGTTLTLSPNEIGSWIYDATAYQLQLTTRQIETSLRLLVRQDKVAVNPYANRYTLIHEVTQLSHPNSAPFVAKGQTVTLITGHTGAVTRIIRKPFSLGDFLLYVEGVAEPVHPSVIREVHHA